MTKKGGKETIKKKRDDREIVGHCSHPHHVAEGKTRVTWEKARKKCIKNFRNKCEWFLPQNKS